MYNVIRFDNGGETLTVLETTSTEDFADVRFDYWSAIFPNAYIDILTAAELAHVRANSRPV
jgi:hypothetical protein